MSEENGKNGNGNGNGEFIDGSSLIRQRTVNLMGVNFDKRCTGVDGERGDSEFKGDDGSQYSQSLTKISDSHQEILRLLTAGMKPKNIAVSLGVHPQTVINIRNSDLGKAVLQMLHAERNVTISKTAERLDALVPQAAEIFEETLYDPKADPSLQYRIARDLLKGRGGLLVEQKTVGHAHAYLSKDEVDGLKKKFKRDFGEEITDVDFESVESEEDES